MNTTAQLVSVHSKNNRLDLQLTHYREVDSFTNLHIVSLVFKASGDSLRNNVA